MLQWHFKAADPPGDCRSDPWFTYQLGKRLKKRYASSTLPSDQGFKNLLWGYESDQPPSIPGEPDVLKILKEVNGYETATGRHLSGFSELKDDGSTTCASWIYSGVFPAPDKNLAARKELDPPGVMGAHLNWGWAWSRHVRSHVRRIRFNLGRSASYANAPRRVCSSSMSAERRGPISMGLTLPSWEG